jgi:hypothetical protein
MGSIIILKSEFKHLQEYTLCYCIIHRNEEIILTGDAFQSGVNPKLKAPTFTAGIGFSDFHEV